MQLQTKTALALVVPVLGCLGVFGWFAYAQSSEQAIDTAVRQLEAIADLKVAQVERLLTTYRREISVHSGIVSGTFAAHGGGRVGMAALPSILQDILDADPEVAAAHFVDEAGRVLASTVLEAPDAVLPETLGPFDSANAVGAGIRVQPYEMRDNEGPRLVVMDPVTSRGAYIGTLVVRFHSTPLLIAIETGVFGETGELLMAYRDGDGNARFLSDVAQKEDAEGTVLAEGDRDEVPMVHALRGHVGVWKEGMRDYAGNDVIAVTRYIDELAWGMVAGVDRAEALLPATRLRGQFLVLAVVLAVFSLVAGRLFGARLGGAANALESELVRRTRAEVRLREVIETSPTAIIGVTESTPGEYVIRLANREAERLLGRPVEALVGAALDSMVSPGSRGRVQAALREDAIASRGEEAPRIDIRVVDAAARVIDVEVSATELEQGDDRTLLITLVDVSDRVRAEQALAQRAEALTKSNRELDQFAHVASHDLKAPLRSVDQLASFIEEDAGPILPEDTREDLELLRSRVARLDRMLDGLLQYSRIGRRDSGATWVNVSQALEGLEQLYLAHENFRLEVVGELPNVWAPEAAVDLVFRNLLMNAVKHHDRGWGVVRVEGLKEHDDVVFYIEDDGPGIEPRFKDRIFGLFETLRPRDEVEASGIGLSIVKKAVEAAGGSVQLVPREGRGARFEVRWPRYSALLVDSEHAA
ncbi:MAG: ATP-binding protein [Gemmatimonadota bacterium]